MLPWIATQFDSNVDRSDRDDVNERILEPSVDCVIVEDDSISGLINGVK